VAQNVAALVTDGATIQIGLGALPAAVLTQLRESNDLGVHSGLITDSIADLIELGVVTNKAKGRDDAQTVTGVVMGTQRLFDFVDGNAAVSLRSTTYTHDPAVLASLNRFTAINSALEVDLTGQINTEVAAGRYVGAHGGAADFCVVPGGPRAAHLSLHWPLRHGTDKAESLEASRDRRPCRQRTPGSS
jgi:acyl-CoA hydrolase